MVLDKIDDVLGLGLIVGGLYVFKQLGTGAGQGITDLGAGIGRGLSKALSPSITPTIKPTIGFDIDLPTNLPTIPGYKGAAGSSGRLPRGRTEDRNTGGSGASSPAPPSTGGLKFAPPALVAPRLDDRQKAFSI